MERTEEQILTQQAKKMTLGGKSYEVKPMTMRKAFAWREKVASNLVNIVEAGNENPTPDALRSAIINSPKEMAEAVFSYLEISDTEREEILDTATEKDLISTFNALMSEVFAPFLAQRAAVAANTDPENMRKMVDQLENQMTRLTRLREKYEGLQSLQPSTLQ